MRGYKHMNLHERVELFSFLQAGLSLRTIGRKLGRCHSTLSRELARNSFVSGDYRVDHAEASSVARRRDARQPLLFTDSELQDYVLSKLQLGWSPEQIAGRLRVEGKTKSISHESIYRYMYAAEGQLWQLLPQRRKRRKPRYRQDKRGAIPQAVSIHDRPDIAGQFGHWEGDLVIFKQTDNHNLTTLVEKVSRYAIVIYNQFKLSCHVMGNITHRLPAHHLRSVTFDQGREFMRHTMLNDCNIATYFCDKASPWQKGQNENFNGRLRRYLPKRHKSYLVTPNMVAEIMEKMNHTPRKCLNYRTPYEVFTQNMQKSGALQS